MPVEDVFSISGRGTVVTGRIERDQSRSAKKSRSSVFKDTRKTVCTGVEMFRKMLDSGQAGDNVGLLLRGIKREEVESGQVVAQPGLYYPPHEVQGRDVYPEQRRRWSSYTVF